MKTGLEQVLYDFQLRAFGEELTRVNQLPVEQRRAYVRKLWEKRRAQVEDRASGDGWDFAGRMLSDGPTDEDGF